MDKDEEKSIIIKRERPNQPEVQDNNTWRSGCLTMDRRAVQYFTQVGVLTCVMGLCIYKLITDDTCVSQQAYTGLLTLTIGILAPSPKFK